MKEITPELIARLYEKADAPVSNDELYALLQQSTGLSDTELKAQKSFGSSEMKTSAVKHKVRWYQQTLRKAGVIEHVPGDRGVWRYALKTEKNLHECWNKMALVGFSTDLGVAIFGNAQQVFNRIDESVTLCVTSPPYLLRHARAYGAGSGRGEQAYIDFILQTLEPIVKQLVTGGSITLNITQDAFNPGRPSRSLYVEKLTLALCENLGLELMDRLIWVNRAKPPSPTHWACKHRVQLAVSYECVLWFTNDAMRVKSDNRRVLQPHSEQHLKLLDAGGEQRVTNYGDGAFQLRHGSYGVKTDGAIAKNTFQFGNACADTRLCHKVARETGMPLHGASSPTRLASFLIEFLSEPGDLVVEPFAGLFKTPLAAERLGRRWLATEKIMEWLAISRNLFIGAPGYQSSPLLDALLLDYQK